MLVASRTKWWSCILVVLCFANSVISNQLRNGETTRKPSLTGIQVDINMTLKSKKFSFAIHTLNDLKIWKLEELAHDYSGLKISKNTIVHVNYLYVYFLQATLDSGFLRLV